MVQFHIGLKCLEVMDHDELIFARDEYHVGQQGRSIHTGW